MTELEYVISNFYSRLGKFASDRIILHGSREFAAAIIKKFRNQFNFIGVMSRDPIPDNNFYGLPVIPENALEDVDPDVVILTERVKYAEAVYQDIREICEQKNILIYNMYGVNEIAEHRAYNTPQPLNTYGCKKLCYQYQIIMFETVGALFSEPDKSGGQFKLQDYLYRIIMDLIDNHIDVRFSLRKSVSEELQIQALEKEEFVPNIRDLLVRRKGEDLSFRTLCEQNPGKKILYISGSGVVNEWILPRCYGIDTWRLNLIDECFYGCYAPTGEISSDEKTHSYIDRDALLHQIREHNIISFDIFDTLLLRKTLYPEDVFELTAVRAEKLGIPAGNFAKLRRIIASENPAAGIDGIYDRLREEYNWDEKTCSRVQLLELETEMDVIVPRKETADLMRAAAEMGKFVVLTSDMVWPEPIMRKILTKTGIFGYQKLFISCDYNKSKQNGLFGEVCKLRKKDERILHIGDNEETDCLPCLPYGIDSVIIPSALALAKSNGWKDSFLCAESWIERSLLGMTVSVIFRDPFQMPSLPSRSKEDRLKRFADSVIGPIVVGFLTWLIRKLKAKHYDSVLFLSRDGYLFQKIYEKIQGPLNLPRSVYFYANRHSSFLTCADDETLSLIAINAAKFDKLNGPEMLQRMYSLSAEQCLPEIPGESPETYASRHSELISKNSDAARKAYKCYFTRCGLKFDGVNAAVDFIAKGTTQAFLEKGLGCRFWGLYFAEANYLPEQKRNHTIEDYLYTEKGLLMQNYIELESFITSPDPPVDHMDAEGNPVFAEEVRSADELNEVRLVLERAERFVLEFFRLFYQEDCIIDPNLIDNMFAAEGCHWVQQTAYNDWSQKTIPMKRWQDQGIKKIEGIRQYQGTFFTPL